MDKLNEKLEKPADVKPKFNAVDFVGVPCDFDIHKYIFNLLQDEPFYAAMSRNIEKFPCTSIPTAGVFVDKELNFKLMYNPAFMNSLEPKFVLGVLQHEFLHLIWGHCTGRKPSDKKFHQLWNSAADCAINSFLEGQLPEFCLFPGKGILKSYPKEMSSEWYFEKMKQDKKFQQKMGMGGKGQGNGEGEIQFDDHSGWDELSDEEKEILKEKLKGMIRKANNECNGHYGTISSNTKAYIIKVLSGTINWREVLRYFIKNSRKADKQSSIRRINKRYPYIHSGKKTNRQANIAISLDQSGSVDDELLSLFFAELDNLSTLATFTVIPFDHSVAENEVFVWKKGQKIKYERVLCGGTNFDAPTRYVNERDFDGHIILTDLGCDAPGPSKCQRMWGAPRSCAEHPYFATNEKIIIVEK